MIRSLAARIRDALRQRGQRTALVAEGTAVSGEELRERALDLAATLRARGVISGETVGLLVDRSVDSVAAILAILDLECAYLPLDPAVPTLWRNHLLALGQVRLLIAPGGDTRGAVVSALGSMTNEPGNDHGLRESRLAYVMGTSGTSGKPKAVPIRASSLLHYCDAFAARLGPGILAGQRMAHVTTLAADLGNTMFFSALLFGGELHLVPQKVSRDPRQFAAYMKEHRIDALKVVPTHLRVLLDQEGGRVLPSRWLVVGGEPFGLDLLARLEACRPKCAVLNHYGPTEATVGIAMFQVETTPGSAERLRGLGYRSVPVGTALGENRLEVVDEELNPRAAGRTGELVVGGPSVATGYLGSPEETTRRFVETGRGLPRSVYRTGDLAKLHSDGELELLGRQDRQFKIRGYRVEATGVEEELRGHPAILDAFVDRVEQGDLGAVLVAWVHAEDGTQEDGTQESVLREFLARRLPHPIVPARIVVMGSLPRTANGKVDTDALSTPRATLPTEASGSAEDAVVRVFSEVLALPLETAHENFFRLGGHSLAALQVMARLRREHGLEVTVEDFYSDASPAGLLRVARSVAPSEQRDTNATPRRDARVSAQAHALWAYLRLNSQDTTYEVPVRLRVFGPVNSQRIRGVLEDLVARHEALRTVFQEHGGKPLAEVHENGHSTLAFVNRGLDIENGPLVSAVVSEICPGEYLVDLLLHHMVYDGISGTVLVRELAALLADAPLPPPTQRAGRVPRTPRGKSEPLGDGARARFGLPVSQRLERGPSHCHELHLPSTFQSRLQAFANALDTTPFVVATAAWAWVLSVQDDESAVTIGTPADLRDPFEEDRLVGYHTNIVVIEVKLNREESIRSLIQRTHSAVGRALEDRHLHYASRVADQRATTGTPPTRTLLTFERLERSRHGEIEIRQEAVVQPRSVFDLDVSLVFADETATLQIHHRLHVCSEQRARCLGQQLDHVFHQWMDTPEAKSADIDILPAEWAERVLAWSHGPTASAREDWGAQALAVHAEAQGQARAFLWPGGEWRRAELVEAVNRAAKDLQSRGLGPGHAVAVSIPPSPALAVAWLAASKVGAAVLALDPDWPRDRFETAAHRAQAEVRITSPDGISVRAAGSVQAEAPHDADLAYLILTSGSTGDPKLVAVQRSALANELSWSVDAFQIDENDRVLAHSSPGFDVTVWEMLAPLSRGASLVFPALGRRNDIPHLAELVHDQDVTVIQAVPSLLEALLQRLSSKPSRDQPSGLRLLVSGGEELPSSLTATLARQFPRAVLLNTYGPSETAIDVTWHRVEGQIPSSVRVPLGRPIAGTRIYIVDDQLRLLPPGAFGQLAIGGKAVGRGYFGDRAETARRFVADPFVSEPEAFMYLSGDRARWNEDGLLEYGGRKDQQVKVRGNRVELEEVEAALRTLTMVRDSAVFFQHAGTPRASLAALVVPSEARSSTVQNLHLSCTRILPSYMVPSVFGWVESLPRLSNGKLDRGALSLEALDTPPPVDDWQSEMEKRVARAWIEVLEHKAVERDLSFFACGGTSLLVPVLQLRLQEETRLTLTIPELFEHLTIRAQAEILERRSAGAEVDSAADGSVTGRGKRRSRAYSAARRRRRG